MLSQIGSTEIIIIVLVLIILFGSQKISDLARNLGNTTKELKDARAEYDKALRGEVDAPIKKKKRKKAKAETEEINGSV